MIRLLIAEDNRVMRNSLKIAFEDQGVRVETVGNGKEAIEKIREKKFDCVITDYNMPEANGLDVLLSVKETSPKTPVVIITAAGDIEKAVEVMKCGATDYILKPFTQKEITFRIKKIMESIADIVHADNDVLTGVDNFLGDCPSISRIKELVTKISDVDSSVLITGETGTGKNLLARIVHDLSNRNKKPFVTVNCSYMPPDLLGSELFGHEKGSFTGAIKQKKGLFEVADNGTAFLDEIGTLDLRTQAMLLRLLQEKEFERIGGTKTIKVDVRVIAATNINIEQAIQEKAFREDLFYRLNVISIKLPALRDRMNDVLLLAKYFLDDFNMRNFREVKFEEGYESVFLSYMWPGNIRELQNVIERAAVLTRDDCISNHDLKNYLPSNIPASTLEKAGTAHGDLAKTMNHFESKLVLKALVKNDWNQSKAADYLGIGRTALIYKMKKYDIKEPS